MRDARVRLIGREIVIGLRALACVITLALHAERVAAASYTVTTFTDTGTGSLRDAITQVNASTDTGNTITFSVKVGQTEQFTATGTYADGSTQNVTSQVQWSSSNPQIATVDANGKMTGKSPGTVTITATLNGVTKTITVTIGAPTPIGITVQPAPASRPSGAAITSPGSPPPAPIPTGR